jgi:ribosome-binding factor A
MARRRAGPSTHRYARSARVNELLREVLAEALERMADTDERLSLLTITAVESDPDLRHARVLFASLTEPGRQALYAARRRLQAVVGAQVHFKRTPQLSFSVDPAVSTGQRVEDILRRLHRPEGSGPEGSSPEGDSPAGSGPGGSGPDGSEGRGHESESGPG